MIAAIHGAIIFFATYAKASAYPLPDSIFSAMNLSNRYQPSLALLTDMYQLTMAQGYWKQNRAEQQAVFHLYFRKNPFKGGYTISAGLEDAMDLLQNFGFTQEDLDFLAQVKSSNQQPLFEKGFLELSLIHI